MTPEELKRTLSQGEGQEIEFKESFLEERQIVESLCAFSNASGGMVVVGVKDDGGLRGCSLGSNTLTGFANALRQNTSPPITATVNEVTVDGIKLVAIAVAAVPQGDLSIAFGRALVRIGKSNHAMSPEEMRRRLSPVRRDEPPVVTASATGGLGTLTVTNLGQGNNFSVRISDFMQNSSAGTRAVWDTGGEDHYLKRGESATLRILQVEPGPTPGLFTFVGSEAAKDEWFKRRRNNVRVVRFLGHPELDIQVPIESSFVFTATVLSDIHDPVSAQFSYGVSFRDELVIPY
jgi:hypothetical protein